jgi:hypothetical protein
MDMSRDYLMLDVRVAGRVEKRRCVRVDVTRIGGHEVVTHREVETAPNEKAIEYMDGTIEIVRTA